MLYVQRGRHHLAQKQAGRNRQALHGGTLHKNPLYADYVYDATHPAARRASVPATCTCNPLAPAPVPS